MASASASSGEPLGSSAALAKSGAISLETSVQDLKLDAWKPPTRRYRSGAPTGALGARMLVWSSVRTVRPSFWVTTGLSKPGVVFHCTATPLGHETTAR